MTVGIVLTSNMVLTTFSSQMNSSGGLVLYLIFFNRCTINHVRFCWPWKPTNLVRCVKILDIPLVMHFLGTLHVPRNYSKEYVSKYYKGSIWKYYFHRVKLWVLQNVRRREDCPLSTKNGIGWSVRKQLNAFDNQ